MELTWFRTPGPDRPGSLNLCYNALDRHVIAGRAGEPALVSNEETVDFATLLERVAELAGALLALGAGPTERVRTTLDDPTDAVLAMLACERLGAAHGDVDAPLVLVTSRSDDVPSARARLLRDVPPGDPARDVTWETATKAGREQPAPCTEVTPDAPAFVAGDQLVLVRDAVGHDSPAGRVLASLCAGRPVDVSTSS